MEEKIIAYIAQDDDDDEQEISMFPYVPDYDVGLKVFIGGSEDDFPLTDFNINGINPGECWEVELKFVRRLR